MKQGNHIGILPKSASKENIDQMGSNISDIKDSVDKNDIPREIISSEVISISSTSSTGLNAPSDATVALLQVKVDSKISVSSEPIVGEEGAGIIVFKYDSITLESKSEIDNFKAITLNDGASGEIFVEYFTK